ncbi:MAG: gamma-glutamyl-phosphate reductase, partial [Planctomycetota bacterium]
MTFEQFGIRASKAAERLATASSELKSSVLLAISKSVSQNQKSILAANQIDLQKASSNGVSGSFLDRLELTTPRFDAMVQGLVNVADLHEPVGRILSSTVRPNGLLIEQRTTSIGVIGVIYESRPNVTADAAALCFKSGNAVILRGGSNAFETNMAIHGAIKKVTDTFEFAEDSIQLINSTDRSAVGTMLSGMSGNIDLIIPRGGR